MRQHESLVFGMVALLVLAGALVLAASRPAEQGRGMMPEVLVTARGPSFALDEIIVRPADSQNPAETTPASSILK